MAEVIWTIKAVEQVEQIGRFIEKDSPFQARRVVQLIIKETHKLKEHPPNPHGRSFQVCV